MLRLRMRTLALLALLFALPLAAQRIDDVTHAAAVMEMAPATLDQLARAAVAPPFAAHEEKVRPAPASKRIAKNAAIVAELVPAPEAEAPAPPARGFRASFDAQPWAIDYTTPADASG